MQDSVLKKFPNIFTNITLFFKSSLWTCWRRNFSSVPLWLKSYSFWPFSLTICWRWQIHCHTIINTKWLLIVQRTRGKFSKPFRSSFVDACGVCWVLRSIEGLYDKNKTTIICTLFTHSSQWRGFDVQKPKLLYSAIPCAAIKIVRLSVNFDHFCLLKKNKLHFLVRHAY